MSKNTIPQWKLRPIFISSTFRDMHAERDYLRNYVLPRLEEELHKRRYHLDWIDLRQGVDNHESISDEQRESLVLSVCLSEIKRSRPYLIVLLGDRYGWVPPGDRIDAATQEEGYFNEALGKSVTALEIEFGIIKESSTQKYRCFFYFRNSLPYEIIPPELRADYSDQYATDDGASDRWKALNNLKARLAADPELKSRIRTYKADWDSEKLSVTGLERWGNQVFDDLWHELEVDTRQHIHNEAPTWEEIERVALSEFVERCGRDFTGRRETIQQLCSFLLSSSANDTAWGICLTGPPGCGKSAIFSKLHNLSANVDVLLLSNAAGATMRGSSVDSMLRRWITELSKFLNIDNPLRDDATIEDIDMAFRSLLRNASFKKRVILLLDAIDQFEPTPRAKHLTWLPKTWPENARLFATAQPGFESECFIQLPGTCEIETPPLTEEDAKNIAQQIWERWHVPWSDDVWQTILNNKTSNNISVTSNPLWTTQVYENLALLNADDFSYAENHYSGDIQDRLIGFRCHLAAQIPPDIPGMYAWLIKRTENVYGISVVQAFICAISLSRHGWRDTDLQVLIPRIEEVFKRGHDNDLKTIIHDSVMARAINRFDSNYTRVYSTDDLPIAKVTAIRRAFRSSLILHNQLQWDFLHNEARESSRRYLSTKLENETTIHKLIAAFLIMQRNDDPVRCDEIAYHLIEAGEYGYLQMFYGSTVTTHERELDATTQTLIDQVNLFGIQRLNQISNIDFGICVTDEKGFPVDDPGLKLEFFGMDIRRDVAKGWVQQCLSRLLPALRSVATTDELNRLVDAMHVRLLDCERDFPNDVELRVLNALMKGDLERESGNLGGARHWYERARDSATQESASYAIACDKIGDIARAQGQLEEAGDSYAQALPLFRKFASEEWDHRRELSLCLSKLGELALAKHNLAAAATYLNEHLTLAEEIAISDNLRADYQRDLAGAHSRLQQFEMANGNMEMALHHAREAHKIVNRLYDLNPGDVTNIQDLAGALYMFSVGLKSKGDTTEAIQCLLKSATVAQHLSVTNQLDAKGRHLLAGLSQQLFDFDEIEKAASMTYLALSSLSPDDPISKPLAHLSIKILDKMLDQQLNDDADWLCDQTLPFCKKVYGEHSNEMVMLLNYAGILRKRKNDLAGAESFYRRAYEEICRLQGPDSPGSLAAHRNLNWVMNKLKNSN